MLTARQLPAYFPDLRDPRLRSPFALVHSRFSTNIGYREPEVRVRDYREIHAPTWDPQALQKQGERCMDCGVPTCMGGCPIGNLIPERNHLVSRGQWREALRRLHATINFPEFTGYTCPAPCEPACVLALGGEAVAVKSIERAIVDKGWSEGWIISEPPAERTGYRVAIVGSGPAGLAAAQQLNHAGHLVTLFERDDAIGGLMVYGIPDFKFAKHQVCRRVQQLQAEGIAFRVPPRKASQRLPQSNVQLWLLALSLFGYFWLPRDRTSCGIYPPSLEPGSE